MKRVILTLGLIIVCLCSFAQEEENDSINFLPIDKSEYMGKIVNMKFYRLPIVEERDIAEFHKHTLTPDVYKYSIDNNVFFFLSLEYKHNSEKPKYASIKYEDLVELKNVFEVLIDQGKTASTTGDASYLKCSYTTSRDVELGFYINSYYKNKKKGEIGYVKKWFLSHNHYKRFIIEFESYEKLYKLICDALAKIESLR